MTIRLTMLVLAVACLPACAGPVAPARLDAKNDVCSSCRMVVSDEHAASQIVSPGEEPRFFDDLGCLKQYLEAQPLPAGSVVYVADHRTGEWARAGEAVFVRLNRDAGAMGSPVAAYASDASRVADGEAAGRATLDPAAVLPAIAVTDRAGRTQ